MIQFNLLPDVKLDFVKTKRLKHTITIVASLVAGVSLVIFVLLFLSVNVVQKARINNLNSQITSLTSDLKKTPDLNTVLEVQDAVNALPTLNSTKPVTTRLSSYISQITPVKASISHLNVSFVTNTIIITGKADSLATVNQYVDTIKQTAYTTSDKSPSKNVFSAAVLTTFSYTSATKADYTITATFDPAIFAQANDNIKFIVPLTTTTHTTATTNSALFQAAPTNVTKTN